MSSTDGIQGRLGESPSGEWGEYQAISSLAVAALLVGVASATALVGVALWIVPLVGILLSCLALVRIDRSTGALIGRPFALVGLSLSVCFAAAALAAHLNSQHLVARQAQQVANQWFQALVQGEPEVAHQWDLTPSNRAGWNDPSRLKSYYENDKKHHDDLTRFTNQKLVALLLRLGPQARVELESTTITRIDDRLSFISLVYRVTSAAPGAPPPFLAELTLEQRIFPGQTEPRSTVRGWRFVGTEPTISAD